MLDLIYIGNGFYSGNSMLTFYSTDWERVGLQEIESALLNNETVNIRPATEKELGKIAIALSIARREIEKQIKKMEAYKIFHC